jgi:hypothetical protein
MVAIVYTSGRMSSGKTAPKSEQRKSARKPKPERRKAVRKEENIHIRVTSAQKEAIAAAADHVGLGASSWVLMLALREIEKADGGSKT